MAVYNVSFSLLQEGRDVESLVETLPAIDLIIPALLAVYNVSFSLLQEGRDVESLVETQPEVTKTVKELFSKYKVIRISWNYLYFENYMH